ncbi:unnamed protein product [Boreogadus saida]
MLESKRKASQNELGNQCISLDDLMKAEKAIVMFCQHQSYPEEMAKHGKRRRRSRIRRSRKRRSRRSRKRRSRRSRKRRSRRRRSRRSRKRRSLHALRRFISRRGAEKMTTKSSARDK